MTKAVKSSVTTINVLYGDMQCTLHAIVQLKYIWQIRS